MTRLLFTILFCVTVLSLSAQEDSYFTIGAGYPLIIGTGNNDDSHYYYSSNDSKYSVFLEKELQLLNKLPELRLTPGFSYTQINEKYDLSALGGGGTGNYEHNALSTYLKFVYKIDRNPYMITDFYFGIHAGYYIHSKTTGSKSSWQVNYDSDEGHYSNYEEFDTDGKNFFHSNYIGIVLGFRPLGDADYFFQPNIEFGLYPAFATVNSYYANREGKKSMFQISVSVGIGNTRIPNEID
nr:hypothetical protein [uncultured Draconibacterium sp.]